MLKPTGCRYQVLPRPYHAGLSLCQDIGSVNIYWWYYYSLPRRTAQELGSRGCLTAASRALPGPGVKLSSGLRRHQRTPGLSCASNPRCCSYPAAAAAATLAEHIFSACRQRLPQLWDLLAACSFWQACPFVANQTALQFHQSSDTIHSRLQFLRAKRRSYHHVGS